MNNIYFRIFYFLFFIFYSIGCAPKISPPPIYKDVELSAEKIISITGRDIHSIKAIANVHIEKDNNPYSNVDASLLLKQPNWIQMRWYNFGLLTGSLIIKDNIVHTASGKGADRFRDLGNELYYSVFWWDDLQNALMFRDGTEYVLRTEKRKIHLDSATLIPKKQEIIANNSSISITYDRPRKNFIQTVQYSPNSEPWFPSVIIIEIGSYRFSVKIDKLFFNPVLGENDFYTPGS
jgi:hypothetical protein